MSKENLDDSVSSHLKAIYFRDKLKWLTSKMCAKHEEAFVQCKIQRDEWSFPPCCPKFELFDKEH